MRPIFRSGEQIENPGVLSRTFGSAYFVVTSAMGLVCAALDGYILHTYWQYLSVGIVVALVAVVGVQMAYQAVRMFRVIPVIEEFDAVTSDENLAPDTPLGEAIGAAVTGFLDKLFFSYGTTLVLLGVVLALLAHHYPS
jgi:hypothetical protein